MAGRLDVDDYLTKIGLARPETKIDYLVKIFRDQPDVGFIDVPAIRQELREDFGLDGSRCLRSQFDDRRARIESIKKAVELQMMQLESKERDRFEMSLDLAEKEAFKTEEIKAKRQRLQAFDDLLPDARLAAMENNCRLQLASHIKQDDIGHRTNQVARDNQRGDESAMEDEADMQADDMKEDVAGRQQAYLSSFQLRVDRLLRSLRGRQD